jgi:uncharacterized DUF497 family protein
MEFEWDEGNRDKPASHGLAPKQVEAAFLDPGRLRRRAPRNETEPRWTLLGADEDGALLFVVYTYRAGRIRVVTARRAGTLEIRQYRRRRG